MKTDAVDIAAYVGRQIRLTRRLKNFGTMELAAAVGATPSELLAWERGDTPIPIVELARVSLALGVDPTALLPSRGQLR